MSAHPSQPRQIAAQTHLLTAHHLDPWAEPGAPAWNPVHTLLIQGEQPAIVDTGAAADRGDLLTQVERVLDPADVRWIVLSHADADHAGNVEAFLVHCPAAVLVTTWWTVQQLELAGVRLPPDRVRWVADGDVIDAGDRVFAVQTPPLYDAGGTIGLLDTTTGVYWAADCFAARVDEPCAVLGEVDLDRWRDSVVRLQQWASPWLSDIEPTSWDRRVERLRRRDLRVIATAHGPAIPEDRIGWALDLLRELPELALVSPPVGVPAAR